MSLKKTWFSYILWFVFAGITALITYVMLVEVLQGFYATLCSYVPKYAFELFCATKIVIVVAVVLLVLLLRLVCSKIRTPSIPRGLGVAGHILFCAGIIAGFCALRYQAFNYAYYLQYYSIAPSKQAMFFYELSKVGPAAGSGLTTGTVTMLEQAYISVIRGLFLFFGNKLEVMYWFQLILQSITLILLMVIGRTLQRGIFAWIPALLYAIAPTFFYIASDAGITNFWTFIVVLGLFVICLLQKAWKRENITYLVMVFAQMLFAGFVFYNKMDVLLYAGAPFVSGGAIPGVQWILSLETHILVTFFVVYCVTFFVDKQDHRSLFIMPMLCFGVLFVWLSFYEFDAFYCMMLLNLLNLYFMISQSIRTIFRAKPDVVTGKPNLDEKTVETKFEWEEMKEVMHSTEGIEVRKEEPVKVELPLAEVVLEEKKEAESIVSEEPVVLIDKKAPIENVLPMPKKHKQKVLDYAFEPAEDMMHYDVEIENDEYDY